MPEQSLRSIRGPIIRGLWECARLGCVAPAFDLDFAHDRSGSNPAKHGIPRPKRRGLAAFADRITAGAFAEAPADAALSQVRARAREWRSGGFPGPHQAPWPPGA